MISQSAFRLSPADRPGSCRRTRCLSASYTTPGDKIFNRSRTGVTGTLETAFVQAGIPAVTVEVGGARIFDVPKIMASVEGVANVLAYYRVTDPKIGCTSQDSNAFFGDKLEEINTSTGGFVELLVKLGQKVKSGQKLAIQRNSFGEVVAEYTTSVDGQVAVWHGYTT